jgi:DNA-directed RNA polymerase subunit K/omega
VSLAAVVAPESMVTGADSASGPMGNRFLVVAVAAQRVLQIRDGARPRLDPGGHKPCVVAVAEVMAGTIPYFVS